MLRKKVTKLMCALLPAVLVMTGCSVEFQDDRLDQNLVFEIDSAGVEDAINSLAAGEIPSVPSVDVKTADSGKKEEAKDTAKEEDPESLLAEGVVPVTWEPGPDNLIIKSDEAKEMYKRIKADDYPSVEELKASPLIEQIDSLSAYYKAVYGVTNDIDTPEREELRDEVLKDFLSIGSARTESVDKETGRHKYVYDGDVEKGYELELVLGLPASGKSSRVTDPDSEEMKAFILDCDVIKEMLPEFQESHGGAADAVHMESMTLMDRAVKELTTGKMKGTNVILPLVAGDFDDLMENYIKPFEEAGYNVRAKFVPCQVNVSLARNLARELETGRIINSAVVFSFGDNPEKVYKKLAPMKNSNGVPYGIEEDEEKEEDKAA